MDELDSLIAQIRQAGEEVWMAGPQSEEAILELERATGFPMPTSYRQFLARFGGFGIVNSFISGIIDGKPLEKGTGWLYGDTQWFREVYGMPEYLLVVQANEDAPYCLDTRKRCQAGEFPLVCYEINSRHVGRMAPSFREWFAEWLRLRAETEAEQ
jgi:hypothetical protein